jgi:hypothetical protein
VTEGWKQALEIGARLVPDLVELVFELVRSGSADPMSEARKLIVDRTDEIRANRAHRDRQLEDKYPQHDLEGSTKDKP